jgi:DNA ligase D-like protein (predicted ligase)
MKTLQEISDNETNKKAQKKSFPGFVDPMLATLTDDYFNDPEWIYERKLDGERFIAMIEDGTPSIYSRNNQKLNNTYPECIDALKQRNYPNLILDGEIVVFDGNVTSFSKLQNRMKIDDPQEAREASEEVYFYFFDILYYQNYSLERIPLRNRKSILKKVIEWNDPIRFVSHRNELGKEYHEEACRKGWEGIIAKDGKSKYSHSRSKKWLKFKCGKSQELVIGGFTEPEGERTGFGALLVGFYKDKALQYSGKVGTGYDDDFLKEWRTKFEKIEQRASPFEEFDEDEGGSIHWVEPKYVGQFAFTEWTQDEKLRHPRFKGMRYDKAPKEVVKEKPQ